MGREEYGSGLLRVLVHFPALHWDACAIPARHSAAVVVAPKLHHCRLHQYTALSRTLAGTELPKAPQLLSRHICYQ